MNLLCPPSSGKAIARQKATEALLSYFTQTQSLRFDWARCAEAEFSASGREGWDGQAAGRLTAGRVEEEGGGGILEGAADILSPGRGSPEHHSWSSQSLRQPVGGKLGRGRTWTSAPAECCRWCSGRSALTASPSREVFLLASLHPSPLLKLPAWTSWLGSFFSLSLLSSWLSFCLLFLDVKAITSTHTSSVTVYLNT